MQPVYFRHCPDINQAASRADRAAGRGGGFAFGLLVCRGGAAPGARSQRSLGPRWEGEKGWLVKTKKKKNKTKPDQTKTALFS